MKTSKKILIISTGLIIAIFITGLMFFRSQVNSLMTKAQLELPYSVVEAGKFYNLDFSSNWIVNIRQGREHKVEIAKNGSYNPNVENIQGTLYFKFDSTNTENKEGNMFARIVTPDVKSIRATGETHIEIKNFQSDSLSVMLEGNGTFISNKNSIEHSYYRTSGNANIEFVDDI